MGEVGMKLPKLAAAFFTVSFALMTSSGVNCQDFTKTTPIVFDLHDIWGTSDNAILAVGDLGTILRFDGTTWSPEVSTTTFDLMAVWVTGFQAFSAGSSGIILSNSGQGWTQVVNPTDRTINALWGESSTNIFGVGGSGVIIHFDGNTWTEVTDAGTAGINLLSVWGSSGNDVFAGGINGNLFHFDGTAWSLVPSFTNEDINAIWSSSPSDVFAAGSLGDIFHFDGTAWSLQDSVGTISLNALWGSLPSDVFAAGQLGKIFHFDGTAWTEVTPFGVSIHDINAVWGSPSGKVFFAGRNGDILLLDRKLIVIASSPQGGQTDVPVSSQVTFRFSRQMDPDTVNGTTMTVKSGADIVAGQVSLSDGGFTAVFTPNNTFANASALTATVTTDVKDLSGDPMFSDFSVAFTTEQAASGEGTGNRGSGDPLCFISCARM
jgi:hypothetical protein